MGQEDKKQEILKAAQECFARFGYQKTTLDDIGRLAGLNKASLYYYYENKKAIFIDVVLMEKEEYIKALQEKTEKVSGCHDKIITYIRERIWNFKNMVLQHNLSLEDLQKGITLFEELYGEIFEREVVFMAGLLDECVANKEIEPGDTARIARSLLVVADGIKHKGSQQPQVRLTSDIDFKKIEEEVIFIVTLILRGLENK